MAEKDNTDTSKIYDMYFHHESFTQLRNSKEYHVFQTRNEKIYVLFDHRYGGCRPIKPIVYSIFVRTYSLFNYLSRLCYQQRYLRKQ